MDNGPDGSRKRQRSASDMIEEDEVSELSSPDSADLGDVEDLLSMHGSDDDLGNENENESEVILANRQCNLSVDAILAREYGGEPPRQFLPSVSPKLADIVNNWLRITPKREKIKDMFKSALLPENVEGLQPVKINEVLYQRLPFRAKLNDQKLHGINTYFSRGIGLTLCVLDVLMKLECILGGDKSPKVDIENGCLKFDDWSLDVWQILTWLGEAIKILSVGNSVVISKCRSGLRPYLDVKFHHLLKPTNPVTQDLLGPDLEQKILDGTRASEVGRKLSTYPHWNQKKRFKKGQEHRDGGHPSFRSFNNYSSNNHYRNYPREGRGRGTPFRGRGTLRQTTVGNCPGGQNKRFHDSKMTRPFRGGGRKF